MTEEAKSEYLASLDRRILDNDAKITSAQRDYSQVSHEIKEVLNRINGGLSPSVNEVKRDNAEIKLSLKDLSHKIDIDMREMKGMVKETTEHTRLMIDNFEKHRLAPVANEVNFIKKTFIYGLVGALIVFLGQKGMDVLWGRVFEKSVAIAVAP